MKRLLSSLKQEELATLRLRSLYEQYGYKKYRMGRFEEYSLYAENKAFLAGEKVISFTDLDGRLMALKPDVTLSIIKNTKADAKNTEKLYYIENVYRESKESHTYKEISQMGLELIGSVDLYSIIEVLILAEQSLSAISPQFLLEVSHMGFVVGLMDSLAVTAELKSKILRCVRNKNSHSIQRTIEGADLTEKQIESLCLLPTLYGDFPSTLKKARAICVNQAMEEALDQLNAIYKAVKKAGYAKKMHVDFSMINDIDYYNGIIFQGYIDGLPRNVLAGGQYDSAVSKLGKNAEAIGFALYLSDLARLPQEADEFDVEALVLYDENADFGALTQAVKGLAREGLRIRAERSVPQGLRYRTLYRLTAEGTLKEESEEDVTC